jgi:hypothetical protein
MVRFATSTLIAIMLVAPSIAVPITSQKAETASVSTSASSNAAKPPPPAHGPSEHKTDKKETKTVVHPRHAVHKHPHVKRPRHAIHKHPHVKHPRRKHQPHVKPPRHVVRKHQPHAETVASSLIKRSDDLELSERELDDIDLAIREVDELIAREPFLGGWWKKVKHAFTIKNIKTGIELAKSLKGRELSPEIEALAAREPLVDAILKTVKEASNPEHGHHTSEHSASTSHGDNPDMYERDLEDLDARDPFLNSFWRKVKPAVTRKNIQTASDLIRTFSREENPEVFERDSPLDELD